MSGYTIASESELSAERLKAAYQEAKTDTNSFSYAQLDIIFEIALQSRELFPRLSGVKSPENYIKHWVNEYRSAIQTPPHARQAKAKSACADPALKKIVMETLGVSESVADEKQAAHNLFMSAENVQGGLLEEYIAVSTKPYGWIWCAGQTLHAVDFCSSDEAVLLQVKNKYNYINKDTNTIVPTSTIPIKDISNSNDASLRVNSPFTSLSITLYFLFS